MSTPLNSLGRNISDIGEEEGRREGRGKEGSGGCGQWIEMGRVWVPPSDTDAA